MKMTEWERGEIEIEQMASENGHLGVLNRLLLQCECAEVAEDQVRRPDLCVCVRRRCSVLVSVAWA
jgi:hypothetical protein